MNFFRKIIDSDTLGDVVLPKNLRNKKVEVIILPCEDELGEDKVDIKKFKGLLKDFEEGAVGYQRRIRDEW